MNERMTDWHVLILCASLERKEKTQSRNPFGRAERMHVMDVRIVRVCESSFVLDVSKSLPVREWDIWPE